MPHAYPMLVVGIDCAVVIHHRSRCGSLHRVCRDRALVQVEVPRWTRLAMAEDWTALQNETPKAEVMP